MEPNMPKGEGEGAAAEEDGGWLPNTPNCKGADAAGAGAALKLKETAAGAGADTGATFAPKVPNGLGDGAGAADVTEAPKEPNAPNTGAAVDVGTALKMLAVPEGAGAAEDGSPNEMAADEVVTAGAAVLKLLKETTAAGAGAFKAPNAMPAELTAGALVTAVDAALVTAAAPN